MNRTGSNKWQLEVPTLKLVIEFGPLPTEETYNIYSIMSMLQSVPQGIPWVKGWPVETVASDANSQKFCSEFSNDILMVILNWERPLRNDKCQSKNTVAPQGTFCENKTKESRRIWQILWKGIVFIQFFKVMSPSSISYAHFSSAWRWSKYRQGGCVNNNKAILSTLSYISCWILHSTFMCILYNQRDSTYIMYFIIIINALHVSGGPSAHHQQPIKLYVQPWVSSCFPVSALYLQ